MHSPVAVVFDHPDGAGVAFHAVRSDVYKLGPRLGVLADVLQTLRRSAPRPIPRGTDEHHREKTSWLRLTLSGRILCVAFSKHGIRSIQSGQPLSCQIFELWSHPVKAIRMPLIHSPPICSLDLRRGS